ncbi:MAG TPA: FAD-dependent oxidoreductase [Candidatus Limnocylindrales bacterium]|nr:FAD-dependent oxidoreductase [Candidatus Limnocylindrales bacterium]
MTRIVIVGAGQAGAQVAFSLRQWGHDGTIALVGDEPAPPYERPPLSKEFLKGELDEAGLYFKTAAWYGDNGVELKTGVAADAIDCAQRVVSLSDGSEVGYDNLVLSTGSRPRALPVAGVSLAGVFELRTMADARRIGEALVPGARALVVGAGYIGLEVAAVARLRGLDVTVLEAMPRVLARVAGPVISEFFESEHRSRGVDIRCGARLAALEGRERLEGARLADGMQIAADIAVVGVGIQPCDELARACGIECDNGIVVDRDARTSDPRVFAAGDCARRPLVHYERAGRLESVHNAIEQGKLAAAAILGRPRPAEDVPWFWSDQYDLKLQIAGLSEGHDHIVVRGNPADRRFAAFYLKDGRLIATDAVNSPMEFMASKQLIARGARPDPALLGDTDVSMKQIVAAHAV